MRMTLSVAMLLTVVGITSRAQAQATTRPARPNIVILLADDLGSSDVGWRGSDVKTPNLDALAASGAKLDQFYVQPICSPTRAALMTGRYPFRYGLQVSVVKPWGQYGLPLDERMLPQALHDVGYETAIVGKWHLGHFKPEYLPMARGFEHQYGHYNGACDYFTHIRDGGYDWHRDGKACYDQGYSTTLIGTEAVRLIEHRDASRPLFLYVPFQAVHAPYEVPDEYKTPYADVPRPRRKTYMGMVASMDEQVGRILASLHAQGMDENTLVLFSSDNGGPEPGLVTRNGDLRAGKGTIYEGGVRTCACARWPGIIPAGTTSNVPMHVVDWYATLLKLGGGAIEQTKPVDGRDVLPALKGDATPVHDEIIVNIGPTFGALRVGDWKLVVNGFRNVAEDGNDPENASTNKPTEYALFDMAGDRQERHDVAADRPDVVARLRTRYEALSKEAAPAFSEAHDPKFQSPKVWGEFP